MNCKLISLCLFIWLILYGNVLYSQVLMPSKGGKVISLNGVWKFKYIPSTRIDADSVFFEPKYDITGWADIKTPGHWELQDFAEPFYSINLKVGTGLYRTTFTVPSAWKDSRVYLAFDGVQYGYSFWVNGHFAGTFASSFNRQTFDITKYTEPGKTNVLAVKVTTRPKGWEFDTNDCWSLSGIIWDVTLFSLPSVHIRDLVVKTSVGSGAANISITSIIEKTPGTQFPENLNLSARLLAPSGKLVKSFGLTTVTKISKADTISYTDELTLEKPQLWTAETPYLYTLELQLNSNKNELQRYTERVGIREITWSNGILKLNGTPIKLRGVNHHELSPINGRSLTEDEIQQDLKLMREANINFIRTSHYPPQPRLLELCDSLGFYVMDEVSFGFGEEHLNDTSYLPILKMRAKSTVWRDKNHPCVIVWSVGNENPLTKLCLETGKYVKSLDPTRPYCFPQIGSYFNKISDNFPDSIDILSPHYPITSTLREYSNKFSRPVIVTEYAHSLGLDFDRMEALWEIMYASPKLAGGAVWDFADQGILRKSSQKISKDEFTTTVWLDSVTMYDNHGNEGADGIVYANRIPQVDYWQVRKVYSPVKVLDDTLIYHTGTQTITLKLINRYDFTDLKEVKCRWQLYADTTELNSGVSPLNCQPHDTLSLPVSLHLPDRSQACYYYLKLTFWDKQNYQFYERTLPVSLGCNGQSLMRLLASRNTKSAMKNQIVTSTQYKFELSKDSGQVQLKNKSGVLLISDGPWARVGRKTTMSGQANTQRNTRDNTPLWSPHLLTKPQISVITSSARNISIHYKYEREYPKNQFLSGNIDYIFSDSGFININYRLVPDSAKGTALEAGVSFLIPASLTEFRWIGKGPYPAYPGKDCLDEFGFYHLNSTDLNFQGNRSNVDCAVFSDAKGNGFAFIARNANIAVERCPDGIVVSHNAWVSGRFNKFSWPEVLYTFENIKEISGSFTIVPLTETWPNVLQNIFGKSNQTAKPFNPFFNSYDQ